MLRRPPIPSRPWRGYRRRNEAAVSRYRGSFGEGEREVLETARDMIHQYGDEASTVAMMRAAESAAFGDGEARAAWDAVTVTIEFLLASRLVLGSCVN